jgi:flagellar biosynthesis regulator FlbT
MNNYEFVKFAANRFGIDETLAESMVDMFAQTLQELISCGLSVT